MSIRLNCPACGKRLTASERLAGKVAKCPACGNSVPIPAATVQGGTPPDAQVSNVAAAGPAPPPIPEAPPPQPAAVAQPGYVPEPPVLQQPAGQANAAPAPSGLNRMKCESCGGVIEYQSGQGYFECGSCGSRYNATADSAGNSIVQTIELRELKEEMRGVRGEMSLERLQKKAEAVQDKIDYSYVEFYHSWPSKAGRAGVLLWIIGAVIILIGLSALGDGSVMPLLLGIGLVGLGVALFFVVFKKAEAAHVAETQTMKAQELEPLYRKIKEVGGALEGGEAFLGYRESTSTPQRYCVNCRQNVTPEKGKGGLGPLHGASLVLTVLTCGMWIPAWILLTIIGSAGGAAKRAVTTGRCPQCGTTPLFPARIKNV